MESHGTNNVFSSNAFIKILYPFTFKKKKEKYHQFPEHSHLFPLFLEEMFKIDMIYFLDIWLNSPKILSGP